MKSSSSAIPSASKKRVTMYGTLNCCSPLHASLWDHRGVGRRAGFSVVTSYKLACCPALQGGTDLDPGGAVCHSTGMCFGTRTRSSTKFTSALSTTATGDGIGYFPGLEAKLDFLQELGISAIWLMPFFPSPLRDDGYDIADYNAVH